MTFKTSAARAARLIVTIALVGCATLLAATAAQGAAVIVPEPSESLQTYQQQLAAGEVKGAVFNTKARSIHLTLADGKHVLVHYAPKHETAELDALKAKGITPLTQKGLPVKMPKAPTHKLRYIVGGVVVVVVILAVVVLVLRRRRVAAD
jgi:hypothetical protein